MTEEHPTEDTDSLGEQALGLELQKTPTGIEGFDEITGGGLPRGRTTLVMGGPGSGKTVFALQTLVHAARCRSEPGIFVAFEEHSRQIIANARTFGWDLPALERDRLFFLDARLPPDVIKAGHFDLIGLLAGLQAKAREMQAQWIVFDAIDILLTLLDDPAAERQELHRLRDWLLNSGLTSILTAKATRGALLNSPRHAFLPYLLDCVVLLQKRVVARAALRELQVLKYRGSGFAENEFPYSIGSAGIEVAGSGLEEASYPVFRERVSTGVPRLDTMLDGGYYRGTSVLITGSPGTAKSTLAGAFAEAACGRGEGVLLVSFDELGGEIVRNLASVGIRLDRHLKSGLLRIHSARTESRSAEEHLLAIRGLIREQRPRGLVIDPLSALTRAGGELTALEVAQRLLRLTKSQGITVVCTSLPEGADARLEATPIQVSTVADTWIHLSYVAQGGERNRALTVVKARGTRHSNQVRELILSDEGITLADVYTAGGEVLMGTARWEKERAEETKGERLHGEVERKRRELELAEAEAQARMEAIRRELEGRRAELALLRMEQTERDRQVRERRQELRRRRGDEGTDLVRSPSGNAGE